jgi:5-methylcytosine-specific restriction protein A
MSRSRSTKAQAYRKWYGLKAWIYAREIQLAKQPLCERCKATGRITPATVVNHRQPHKGNWKLFIDPTNHESVCAPHHDGLIQKEEARGHRIGSTADGRPVDPMHPWNRL